MLLAAVVLTPVTEYYTSLLVSCLPLLVARGLCEVRRSQGPWRRSVQTCGLVWRARQTQ